MLGAEAAAGKDPNPSILVNFTLFSGREAK